MPDDSEREDQRRIGPGNRPQRLGGIGRRVDVGDPAGVEGGRGRQDDRQSNQVRSPHPDNGVELDPLELGLAFARGPGQRVAVVMILDLFSLF